jgi:NitT/TauT family transport system substrate-binding protein
VGSHGDAAMAMVCDGRIDAASMRPSLYFYQEWNEQHPAAMVADGGRLVAGKGGGAIVARPALTADGTLRGYADLRGLRIGLSPDKGDHDWLTIAAALRKGGLSWNDVEVVECDYGDGRHEALAAGSIDVTTVSNAKSVAEGQTAGAFVPWKFENDVEDGRQAAAVIFSPTLRQDRDCATRYLTAYMQGVRDYYGAFHDGRGMDDVIGALASESGLGADAVARDVIPLAIDPNGALNEASIGEDLDWLHAAGAIPLTVTAERVVDYSYRDAALAVLGRPAGRD